jgi:anti-sigma B factor antagonist
MNSPSILRPQGRIDAQVGEELLAQVAGIVAENSTDILIDFADVDFMDSCGLGSLVMTLKRVREKQKQIYLCCLNSQLKLVLELTSMDRIFKVFDTKAECLKYISESQAAS